VATTRIIEIALLGPTTRILANGTCKSSQTEPITDAIDNSAPKASLPPSKETT